MLPSATMDPLLTTTTAVPIDPLLAVETSFTMAEFSVTRIALFCLFLLLGLAIHFDKLHAKNIMICGGLMSSAYVTGISVYSQTHSDSFGGMLLMTVGATFVELMMSCSLAYFVPFAGPAGCVSLLLLCGWAGFECAVGVRMHPLVGAIPVLGGIVIGLVVYFSADVQIIRGKFFYWPDSTLLRGFHNMLTCAASSFLLITGILYFSHLEHTNMVSIARAQLGPETGECNRDVSILSLLVWLGIFLIELFTFTHASEELMLRAKSCWTKQKEVYQARRVRKSVLYFGDADESSDEGNRSADNP